MSLPLLLAIAVGGGVGSALRYLIDNVIQNKIDGASAYPWGTTVINITGSFLLGMITGLAAGQVTGGPWLPVLGVGLLGGYTTFSTASVETVRLLLHRRYRAALGNGLGTLLACVLAASGGLLLGRLI